MINNLKALELVAKIQKGEIDSFGKLYDYYFPLIYKFIYYHVQHRENSEDLTSLCFTKALEKINDFKLKDGKFSAWLYKIARNAITDHWRTKKQTLELEKTMEKTAENNFLEKIDNQELLKRINEKLNLLKPKQKQIIIMRLWQELSYQEISQILNKSEASCKMYFSRSIKVLRQSLNIWFLIFINLIN